MGTVRLAGVSKRFGETPVLDHLDLELAGGEFTVIVGPSGCGKSTLMRLIAGIDSVSSGAIFIDGRDVARVHPGRRNVAMVFQDYALYPHMSVEKNLSFGMRARRAGTREEIAARVQRTATTLQIEHLLRRKPAQLSGGQRQRVALGRAMMRDPEVYLMDEPLSNLDAALRVQVREDLIQFHKDTGGTILYVTHDQVEAMTMGQRVLVMREGRIHQSGTPEEIYDHPADLFVATFVGSPRMNVLDARIERSGVDVVLIADDLAWRMPGAAAELPAGVRVGFRPEAVKPATGSAAPDVATFSRGLDYTEFIGHEAILRLGDPANRLLARVPATVGRATSGETAYEIALADLHLFDGDGLTIAHGDELATGETAAVPATG